MKSTNVTGNSYSIFCSWSKSQNNLRHRRKEYCSERTVHKEQLTPTNDATQTSWCLLDGAWGALVWGSGPNVRAGNLHRWQTSSTKWSGWGFKSRRLLMDLPWPGIEVLTSRVNRWFNKWYHLVSFLHKQDFCENHCSRKEVPKRLLGLMGTGHTRLWPRDKHTERRTRM